MYYARATRRVVITRPLGSAPRPLPGLHVCAQQLQLHAVGAFRDRIHHLYRRPVVCGLLWFILFVLLCCTVSSTEYCTDLVRLRIGVFRCGPTQCCGCRHVPECSWIVRATVWHCLVFHYLARALSRGVVQWSGTAMASGRMHCLRHRTSLPSLSAWHHTCVVPRPGEAVLVRLPPIRA